MKNVSLAVKEMVVLGIMFAFIGVIPVSAKRAVTDSGLGCLVRVGLEENDYALDPACSAHDVLKLDEEGNLEFYVYQDHGQLPEVGWRPTSTFRTTFEVCYQFSFGVTCGTAKESVTPSGQYTSSFRSY